MIRNIVCLTRSTIQKKRISIALLLYLRYCVIAYSCRMLIVSDDGGGWLGMIKLLEHCPDGRYFAGVEK